VDSALQRQRSDVCVSGEELPVGLGAFEELAQKGARLGHVPGSDSADLLVLDVQLQEGEQCGGAAPVTDTRRQAAEHRDDRGAGRFRPLDRHSELRDAGLGAPANGPQEELPLGAEALGDARRPHAAPPADGSKRQTPDAQLAEDRQGRIQDLLVRHRARTPHSSPLTVTYWTLGYIEEVAMSEEIGSAVVTGAGSGIGRALVTQLVATGVDVTAVDIDRDALRPLEAELGVGTACLDVADRLGFDALAQRLGAPDLLCLNAGIASAQAQPVWSTPDDEWDRVLAVNLGGVRNGLAVFVPRFVATGRRHRVLITASLAGVATWPGGGAYAASKHAVVAIAEQAALSLMDTTVSVTLLCPALVRSGMSPVGEDPEQVAAAALAACRHGRFALIPDEWHAAVQQRATRLVAGAPPALPQPCQATGAADGS